MHAKLLQFCLTLCNPLDCQALLSMGLSGQEYWSGLLCPPSGDLPHQEIEHASPAVVLYQAGSLPAT